MAQLFSLGAFEHVSIIHRIRILRQRHIALSEWRALWSGKAVEHLDGVGGHKFELSSQFEEPACPVEIECRRDGALLYKAALRVGVHTSDDWESLDLASIHTLAFRCRKEDDIRA